MKDEELDFFDLDLDQPLPEEGEESPEPEPEPKNDETYEVDEPEEVIEILEPEEAADEAEYDDDEEEDEALKVNYEYLKQLGVLNLPDDFKFKATDKGFEDAVKASHAKTQNDLFRGLFDDMPEQGKALLDYYANGGTDVAEFIKVYSTPDFTKLDLDEEANQEFAVRELLKRTTRFSEAKINKEIDNLKNSYRLREEAEDSIAELSRVDAEDKQTAMERAKQNAINEEKALRAEIAELSKTIKSTKEIKGVPITDKDEALIINSLYRPIKLQDGSKTTSFNYKLNNALADPQKRALLAKLVETDFDFSYLARSTKTAATLSLKKSLKEAQKIKGGKVGGKSGFDIDTVRLDF